MELRPFPDLASGSNPCSPAVIKPYLSIIGDHDTVLQTTGEAQAQDWVINPFLVIEPAAWADAVPMVMNDELFYPKRVALKCASKTVNPPAVSGRITTYSDCSGSLKLEIIAQTTINGKPSGGDHCLLTLNGQCVTTLRGDTALDFKTEAVNFLKQF